MTQKSSFFACCAAQFCQLTEEQRTEIEEGEGEKEREGCRERQTEKERNEREQKKAK